MYILKESQPTLFGDKVYINDYFLLVDLPEWIKEEVKNFKQELTYQIGPYDAVNSLAHISLLRFLCIAEHEDKLIHQLESCCQQQNRILIQLNHFNQFNHSHTLFIDITEKPSISQLHHQLFRQLKLNMRGIKLSKLNFDPHLTIGKKLSSNQFLTAVEAFSKKQYQKKFLCTHLTLLRHSYDYRNEREFWMKVREIPLGKPLIDVNIAA